MLYVLIITMAISMLAFAMGNLIEINQAQVMIDRQNKDYNDFAANKMRMVTRMVQSTNSWWTSADILSCSGWEIKSYEWQAPICTWTWEAWPDGVSDTCDNDDYRWSYSSWAVTATLYSDSKPTDNDDYSRRTAFWFIAPKATDTVFAANDQIRDFIDANPNNTGSVLSMGSATGMIISWNFSSVWNTIETFKLNKSGFNISNKVDVISSLSWTITDNTWYLLSSWNFSATGAPYVFDFANYDYAVNVTNAASELLSYELSWTSSWTRVYISPIDDSKEEMKAIFPYYVISPWKAYYRWQETYFWSRTPKYQDCLLPWWATIPHAWTVVAYNMANPVFPTLCQSETRSCNDWQLAGINENQDCTQNYIYTWNLWDWSPCSQTCWDWTQTRTVTCQRNDWAVVDDSFCWVYPGDTQICNMHECPCVVMDSTYSCDHSSAWFAWNTFHNVNPLIFPPFSFIANWTVIYSGEILYETTVMNFGWWLKCSDGNIIWDDWVSGYLYLCN
ncbi:MAG: hypothetical protein ACD_2C00184G0007 [uncultured bacterium (gcode 4)]|uniref:Uncharacterized protein n=1 Tax=uncultured bacterium (gcode 4) TaxID=1234023 RepID=K2H0N4_9BACT|nr:MAG: hypothetical protein ACD_2C00184G0007 [uncultured bacterium (gcode 4)]